MVQKAILRQTVQTHLYGSLESICVSLHCLPLQYCFILLRDATGIERHCSRVVRAVWLWCRKSPYSHEFAAGLCHTMIGKLSAQQYMGTFFQIWKG